MRRRHRAGPPPGRHQKSGTIILASEGQYAPFNFFQGKQLTGYEIEVGEAVAKKMGLKFEWKTVGF